MVRSLQDYMSLALPVFSEGAVTAIECRVPAGMLANLEILRLYRHSPIAHSL
jgi:hypothetical protein